MNARVIFVILTGLLVVAGCGDGGSASRPATTSSSTDTSVQPLPASPAVSTKVAATLSSALPASPASSETGTPGTSLDTAAPGAGLALQSAANVVATPPVDPPSAPLSMSAGVTETVDPPGTSPALAPTIAPSNAEPATVAQEPFTPVVHYPPEPAAGSGN
jgi:hypothetical protein